MSMVKTDSSLCHTGPPAHAYFCPAQHELLMLIFQAQIPHPGCFCHPSFARGRELQHRSHRGRDTEKGRHLAHGPHHACTISSCSLRPLYDCMRHQYDIWNCICGLLRHGPQDLQYKIDRLKVYAPSEKAALDTITVTGSYCTRRILSGHSFAHVNSFKISKSWVKR